MNTNPYHFPQYAHCQRAEIQGWAVWSDTILHEERLWHVYDCDLKSSTQNKKYQLKYHQKEPEGGKIIHLMYQVCYGEILTKYKGIL